MQPAQGKPQPIQSSPEISGQKVGAVINDGGSAFPQCFSEGDQLVIIKGLSRRDYFAAFALMGMLAKPEGIASVSSGVSAAFGIADAMLEKSKEAK